MFISGSRRAAERWMRRLSRTLLRECYASSGTGGAVEKGSVCGGIPSGARTIAAMSETPTYAATAVGTHWVGLWAIPTGAAPQQAPRQ